MAGRYARPLKVSTPDGERIVARVLRHGDQAKIEVNYLEVVKKDDPPFAHNGVISFNVPVANYPKTIELLTRYLEDLFLKGMADEDIYTGLGAKPKPRRTAKRDSGGKTSSVEREGDSPGVHLSPRRDEQTKSSWGRKPSPEVAEGGDPSDSAED